MLAPISNLSYVLAMRLGEVVNLNGRKSLGLLLVVCRPGFQLLGPNFRAKVLSDSLAVSLE